MFQIIPLRRNSGMPALLRKTIDGGFSTVNAIQGQPNGPRGVHQCHRHPLHGDERTDRWLHQLKPRRSVRHSSEGTSGPFRLPQRKPVKQTSGTLFLTASPTRSVVRTRSPVAVS